MSKVKEEFEEEKLKQNIYSEDDESDEDFQEVKKKKKSKKHKKKSKKHKKSKKREESEIDDEDDDLSEGVDQGRKIFKSRYIDDQAQHSDNDGSESEDISEEPGLDEVEKEA